MEDKAVKRLITEYLMKDKRNVKRDRKLHDLIELVYNVGIENVVDALPQEITYMMMFINPIDILSYLIDTGENNEESKGVLLSIKEMFPENIKVMVGILGKEDKFNKIIKESM